MGNKFYVFWPTDSSGCYAPFFADICGVMSQGKVRFRFVGHCPLQVFQTLYSPISWSIIFPAGAPDKMFSLPQLWVDFWNFPWFVQAQSVKINCNVAQQGRKFVLVRQKQFFAYFCLLIWFIFCLTGAGTWRFSSTTTKTLHRARSSLQPVWSNSVSVAVYSTFFSVSYLVLHLLR
jgi:hypothetical protein